jgi:hypothetical protein
LEKAGQLEQFDAPQKVMVDDGKTTLQVQLPRQATALFILEWQ